MKLIHVDQVIVPHDRARKEFDPNALQELKASILSQGLFHPLLLQRDERTLVAGERRLRVLRDIHFEGGKPVVYDGTDLPRGQVPFVVRDTPDEIGVLQSELDENKRRANLTWAEEATFISRIHQLLKAQNPSHTKLDTRNHLQAGSDKVSGSLIIAQFLEDKEISGAKSLEEGLKILEKKLERSHREAIARRLGGEAEGKGHYLLQGDLRVVLPTMPEAIFDCIFADPPYGVNAHSWANMSAAGHPYEDAKEYSNELYSCIATEGWRVAKPLAHAYIFCDSKPQRIGEIMSIFSAAGWRVWPWPIIYSRGPTNGILPWPEHGPRRTFESIVFAVKGNRRTLGVFPDVITCSDRLDEERGAHKPASLYADLIARSCLPGDKILDPCLGTGAILDAATGARVHTTGIEIESAAFARAQERLK